MLGFRTIQNYNLKGNDLMSEKTDIRSIFYPLFITNAAFQSEKQEDEILNFQVT